MLSEEAPAAPMADTLPEGVQRTRLIINRIVLENFKSYAGRQVVGPFHKVFLPIHNDDDVVCSPFLLSSVPMAAANPM